jgi:tRNA pseudouridine38-40 synthase
VRSTFHARHSALAKTYEYRVFRETICPPFLARYVYACPWPMDVDALQRSAHLFEGRHNFLSFAATDPDLTTRTADCQHERAQDTIEPTALSQTALLVYRVRGSGFLHHMVRNLVGTMLDIGRGRIPVDEIPKILAARSRSAAGPTAPAQGLFLHSVEYPTQEENDPTA